MPAPDLDAHRRAIVSIVIEHTDKRIEDLEPLSATNPFYAARLIELRGLRLWLVELQAMEVA